MHPSRERLKARMDRFKRTLKKSGIKLTHQRLEIYKELSKSINHPDAVTIFKSVRKRVPTISLDTVYRTLWMFLDLNIINTLGTNHKKTRFDANIEDHHHLVCSNCGLTLDFYSRELDELKVPHNTEAIGNIQTIQVIIKGICNKCIKKTKK